MDNHTKPSGNRRGFLKQAAVTTAATAAAFAAADSASAGTTAPRRLKIGVLGVKNSFTSYSWSDLIEHDSGPNNPKGSTIGTPFLSMDITQVWDLDFEASQKFADRMGATAVKSYDGMAGKVDGIICGGMDEVPWYKYLLRPYLEAKTPAYLSRPFAHSLADIDVILDMAQKNDVPILATAKFEHYNEVPAMRQKCKELGVLKLVHATGNSRDFPMHFHIMNMMLQILGVSPKQVSLVTDGASRNTYCQLTLKYGESEGRPPFLCTIHGVNNQDQFSISAFGEKYTVTTNMLRSPEWRDSLLFRYAPQVIEMQRTFEGNLFEPYENIRAKTAVWLTAMYSHLERDGGMVDVASLPVNWTAPYFNPDLIDVSMFKK